VAAAQCLTDLSFSLKIQQLGPFGEGWVAILSERLAIEGEAKTLVRDELVGSLCAIGGNIVGDRFPFDECIPLVLKALPLVHNTAHYGMILTFLTSVVRVLSVDVKFQVTTVIVNFLAQPYADIIVRVKIDELELRTLLKYVTTELPLEVDFAGTALRMLDGDPVKLQFFLDTFENLPLAICQFTAQTDLGEPVRTDGGMFE
jgi:hypothetical protein